MDTAPTSVSLSSPLRKLVRAALCRRRSDHSTWHYFSSLLLWRTYFLSLSLMKSTKMLRPSLSSLPAYFMFPISWWQALELLLHSMTLNFSRFCTRSRMTVRWLNLLWKLCRDICFISHRRMSSWHSSPIDWMMTKSPGLLVDFWPFLNLTTLRLKNQLLPYSWRKTHHWRD